MTAAACFWREPFPIQSTESSDIIVSVLTGVKPRVSLRHLRRLGSPTATSMSWDAEALAPPRPLTRGATDPDNDWHLWIALVDPITTRSQSSVDCMLTQGTSTSGSVFINVGMSSGYARGAGAALMLGRGPRRERCALAAAAAGMVTG